MEVKEVYKEYDKRTIEYMSNLVDQLNQDYGQVPASWRISLDLIADNLDLYFKLKDQLKQDGLYATDGRGRTAKNQILSVYRSTQAAIINLIQQFGATPMSKAKLKVTNNTNIEDLLNVLTN